MDIYTQLDNIEKYIHDNYGNSYNDFDNLCNNNQLDPILFNYGIDSLLKKELDYFLELIDPNNYDHHEYLKTIYINECNFINVYKRFGYILSLHFNKNNMAYRVLPSFIKECLNYFNIEKYTNYSVEDIERLISRYLILEKKYDCKYKKELIEIKPIYKELFTDYSKYDSKLVNRQEINYSDKDELFVFSEYVTYEEELRNISKYNISNPYDYVRWVSRYDGDGYGYDILSYDFENNREKIIEVKSGKSNYLELTRVEYRNLMNTIKNKYSDYYIYKYYNIEGSDILTINTLKYDKEKKVFIDINTNEIYRVVPFFKFDENGYQQVKVSIIKDEQYKLLLNK